MFFKVSLLCIVFGLIVFFVCAKLIIGDIENVENNKDIFIEEFREKHKEEFKGYSDEQIYDYVLDVRKDSIKIFNIIIIFLMICFAVLVKII